MNQIKVKPLETKESEHVEVVDEGIYKLLMEIIEINDLYQSHLVRDIRTTLHYEHKLPVLTANQISRYYAMIETDKDNLKGLLFSKLVQKAIDNGHKNLELIADENFDLFGIKETDMFQAQMTIIGNVKPFFGQRFYGINLHVKGSADKGLCLGAENCTITVDDHVGDYAFRDSKTCDVFIKGNIFEKCWHSCKSYK